MALLPLPPLPACVSPLTGLRGRDVAARRGTALFMFAGVLPASSGMAAMRSNFTVLYNYSGFYPSIIKKSGRFIAL
jgi:hypothetical protein